MILSGQALLCLGPSKRPSNGGPLRQEPKGSCPMLAGANPSSTWETPKLTAGEETTHAPPLGESQHTHRHTQGHQKPAHAQTHTDTQTRRHTQLLFDSPPRKTVRLRVDVVFDLAGPVFCVLVWQQCVFWGVGPPPSFRFRYHHPAAACSHVRTVKLRD